MHATLFLRNTCTALCLSASPLLHAQQAPAPACDKPACNIEPTPTDGEPAVAIVRKFIARHKNFIPCQQNATAMGVYLDAHHLNPLDENSFEKAFDDLRHQGRLQIASK